MHGFGYEVFPLDFAKVFLFGRNSYPYYRSSFSTACHRWDPSFPVRLPTRPKYYSRCLLKIEYWCHLVKTIKAQSLRYIHYKKTVEQERPRNFFKIRFWGQEEIINELLKSYDSLDEETKAKIPLKKMWSLTIDKE